MFNLTQANNILNFILWDCQLYICIEVNHWHLALRCGIPGNPKLIGTCINLTLTKKCWMNQEIPLLWGCINGFWNNLGHSEIPKIWVLPSRPYLSMAQTFGSAHLSRYSLQPNQSWKGKYSFNQGCPWSFKFLFLECSWQVETGTKNYTTA